MMQRFWFFLRYAFNGLKSGGQRIVIAILAVAFGVMSLVAMADIANAVNRTVSTDPRTNLGGDLRLTANDMTQLFSSLESLQDDGTIEAYSRIEEAFFLLMRTSDSGRVNFVQSGLGIDPASYPLLGDFTMSAPRDSTASDLLQATGDVLITRDIANRYDVMIDDELRLALTDGTALPITMIVRGIVSNNPDHTGGRIYYNLETSAQLLGNDAPIRNYVTVLSDNPTNATSIFTELGWQVQQVDLSQTPDGSGVDLFDFMLRGAGILGLIVGGIGIANTMQVLLAKRHQEVGILKTLGYSQRDMILIFVLEALFIALLGSGIGILFALLLGQGLIQLFANVSTLLFTWELDVVLISTSLLTGVLTTIIFAFQAILKTSGIRPSVIFRQTSSAGSGWRNGFKMLGFYAFLSIPFALVTSLFLDSVIKGFGIVLFAIAGFLVLGLIFRFVLWIILRLLPTLGSRLLGLARNNMRKRASSMIFAMIALFVGIFTLGFALTVIQVGFDQLTVRQDNDNDALNLLVYADNEIAPQITMLLNEQVNDPIIYQRAIATVSELLVAEQSISTTIQVRESAWDVNIIEGVAFNDEEGIYIPESSSFAIGDIVSIQVDNQTTEAIPIIGRYTMIDSLIVSPISDMLMSQALAQSLNLEATRVNIYASISPELESTLAQQVGEQFTDSMTLTQSDLTAQINGLFMNLLGFAMAMSGLALLAGVMLIANVVSLAMLERRFEIGVMKAIGYTQGHIITLIALENSLIGFISALLALIGVQVTIMLITTAQASARDVLFIKPVTALIMIGFAVALTMITALITAWQPLHIKPSIVLNEKDI